MMRETTEEKQILVTSGMCPALPGLGPSAKYWEPSAEYQDLRT